MNFNSTLIQWYSLHKRELPWRQTKDPYYIWLSEIILQQTQIKQGLPYYEAFTKRYPTVHDLAKTTEDEVLKLWQGLGYYSRARNLHHTAKHISTHLHGVFPKTYMDLLQLKGVGDYTASAVASICYEEAVAVVDGNVYRVLSRYFGIDTPINSSPGIKQFKTLATSLLPKDNIGDYNQAIMEFGALQCAPKSPNCSICPLYSTCVAAQTGRVSKFPIKLKSSNRKQRFLNYLVVLSKDHHTVMEQRTHQGIWQNLYQFPLVETSGSMGKEDLLSNKDFKVKIQDSFNQVELFKNQEIIHKLTHQDLHIKFWLIRTPYSPKNSTPWAKVSEYAVPKPIEVFVNTFSP